MNRLRGMPWASRIPRRGFATARLAYRTEFRGLPISIETDAGEAREWTNPDDGSEGSTIMQFPYGYIRLTEGLDSDAVDVFLGPHEDADTVYVVTQLKAPDFREVDEQKCLLGFRSEFDARRAYQLHYTDPRFFGGIAALPLHEFKAKVLATLAHPGLIKGLQVWLESGCSRRTSASGTLSLSRLYPGGLRAI